MDPVVDKAPLARVDQLVTKDHAATKDQLVIADHKDRKAHKETVDPLVEWVLVDQMVQVDLLDPQDLQDQQDLKDLKGLKALQDLLVAAVAVIHMLQRRTLAKLRCGEFTGGNIKLILEMWNSACKLTTIASFLGFVIALKLEACSTFQCTFLSS